MTNINKILKVYPDITLKFYWYNDFLLHLYIPDEFDDLYNISIGNDGYLTIKRN